MSCKIEMPFVSLLHNEERNLKKLNWISSNFKFVDQFVFVVKEKESLHRLQLKPRGGAGNVLSFFYHRESRGIKTEPFSRFLHSRMTAIA